MKKWLVIVFIGLLIATPARAYEETGSPKKGFLSREGEVLGRGIANVVGFFFEIPRTIGSEAEIHRWSWPVTAIPRVLTHMAIRGASAATDIFFYPWAVPFTESTTPWTEHFGLPDYPWQME